MVLLDQASCERGPEERGVCCAACRALGAVKCRGEPSRICSTTLSVCRAISEEIHGIKHRRVTEVNPMCVFYSLWGTDFLSCAESLACVGSRDTRLLHARAWCVCGVASVFRR